MPSKPVKQGFKFHYPPDYDYIWEFNSTSIKAGPNSVPSTDGLTGTRDAV
jgi:hypothetical protein